VGAQTKVKYQCPKCLKYQKLEPRHPRTAKILLLDIETLYMEVRGIWNLKTEYIRPSLVVKDWSILCWAAKWLFEPDSRAKQFQEKRGAFLEQYGNCSTRPTS